MKRKLFVLHVPETRALDLDIFVMSTEAWTLLTYQMESGFFAPKLLCVHLVLFDRDEQLFQAKVDKLKQSFPNEIKHTQEI
jgi:hypothetical protein